MQGSSQDCRLSRPAENRHIEIRQAQRSRALHRMLSVAALRAIHSLQSRTGPVNTNATERRHRVWPLVKDVVRLCRRARSVPLCKFRVRVAADRFACAFHVARASRCPCKANEPMLTALRRTWLIRMQKKLPGRTRKRALHGARVSVSVRPPFCVR